MPAHPQAEDVATAVAGGSIRRGVVTGAPRIVLMIEGGVVLLAASAAYAHPVHRGGVNDDRTDVAEVDG